AYTGGINILGAAWHRPDDNIGLAYGYYNGGNQDIDSTHVAEVYYRWVVNEYFSVTADAQYMKDNVRGEDGPGGFILGLRGTARF
ncbi:MAG: carbohydrate porin, partial [bacterium]|nr:carbohydrate porin [bacterium]